MTQVHEISPLPRLLDDYSVSSDVLFGKRGLDITFSEFDNMPLPRKVVYLHKLADENVAPAVLDNVFKVWPKEKEGAEALAAYVRELPWGRVEYIVPFLARTIDDKRLSDTARLKVALFAMQPTDENIQVQRRDQQTQSRPPIVTRDSFASAIPKSKWQSMPKVRHKTIAEHHFGDGLVRKATQFVQKIDHELAECTASLPSDPRLAAQAIIRAKEIDRLKFNTGIPSKNAAVILHHWEELATRAGTDSEACLRCWHIASCWVKSEGDAVQRRDLEAGWYITEGVARTSKEAFPDYDQALAIPADSQFARAVQTTLNHINTGTISGAEETAVKEFLHEMMEKDTDLFNSLVTAAIKRLHIEDDGRYRDRARAYMVYFHDAIGATIPDNLDEMIVLMGRNEPSLFVLIKHMGKTGSILHFTVINFSLGDDDRMSMTAFVSAVLRDENGECSPRQCIDGDSLRSHDYLARYLGSDTPDTALTTAENELATLTDGASDENVRIVRNFLIALEREIFFTQKYPPESMKKLEEIATRILPWAEIPEAMPLIVAIYHLSYGFTSDEFAHRLDEATGLNAETIADERMGLAIAFFVEARKFIGYHFYSPGLKKIYESGVKLMNQTAQRWREAQLENTDDEQMTIAQLRSYFQLLRYIDILKKGETWHLLVEEDSDYITSYQELISAAEGYAKRIEESFTQTKDRGFLEAVMRYFTRLDDADQAMFLDISLDHEGRFSSLWLELARNLDREHTFDAASVFFVNIFDNEKIAVLFHRLLILSDREIDRENLLEAKELLIQEALAMQDLYEYPQLINLRELIRRLGEGLYFARSEREGLVDLVRIGKLPSRLKWPLDRTSDMEVVVQGELLPLEADDPRLTETERIRRYIKKTFRPSAIEWTSKVDTDGIIRRLKAPQVAERVPIAVTRLPILEEEAGMCEDDICPRVELFAGETVASEGRVGIDGNLVIRVNDIAETPAVYSLPFYVTTRGIRFIKRPNSPRYPTQIPIETNLSLESAILHQVDSIITAEYTAHTLMKMMSDLPAGTPGIGDFSSAAKIRYGQQLAALAETIGEKFMIVDEAPNMWIADGKEVIITGDGWYWRNWSEVIEKKAKEFSMTPSQYFAKLFEHGVKLIFIGRPVDEESFKGKIDDREVSTDPGAVTGFEYDDPEIAAIYLDEGNWQPNKKRRLVKLPDQRRPTRANCIQARSYKYRIIVYWSIEALEGGGFRETFHRTTFRPPELTAEAKARVAAIRARKGLN